MFSSSPWTRMGYCFITTLDVSGKSFILKGSWVDHFSRGEPTLGVAPPAIAESFDSNYVMLISNLKML